MRTMRKEQKKKPSDLLPVGRTVHDPDGNTTLLFNILTPAARTGNHPGGAMHRASVACRRDWGFENGRKNPYVRHNSLQ